MTFKIFQNILILFLIGCSSNENLNLNITSNIKNNMQLDETFNFSINEAFDSIKIYSRGKLINSTKNNELNSTNIDLKKFRLGENNLNIISYYKDNVKSKNYDFIILNDKKPTLYSYEIINTYPHNINAYTQGLEFNQGFLYESTGQKGRSKLKRVNYKTGESNKEINVSNKYFAEGLTIIDNKIIQLTWRENTGLVYNLNTMDLIDDFKYGKSIEGWGLCNDKNKIFKSDGTENIWILDSKTYEEIDNIQVYTNKGKVNYLNELEWVNGKIYANIYLNNGVAIINPENGAVEGVIDLSGLKKMVTDHDNIDVLNGIAYNNVTGTLFVTGKMWDKIFEIEILKK
ncbi:glutaminyl-peptide cyclotransferase [Flavobacteriaceae bacterium]|nr:glutaminyl-peptide cyclotransferase [Flavobacteriaceae bacterium]MDC1493086.1 glutaminyl-peptide cyclotransferase [Flavobacteriaceae bacterium]